MWAGARAPARALPLELSVQSRARLRELCRQLVRGAGGALSVGRLCGALLQPWAPIAGAGLPAREAWLGEVMAIACYLQLLAAGVALAAERAQGAADPHPNPNPATHPKPGAAPKAAGGALAGGQRREGSVEPLPRAAGDGQDLGAPAAPRPGAVDALLDEAADIALVMVPCQTLLLAGHWSLAFTARQVPLGRLLQNTAVYLALAHSLAVLLLDLAGDAAHASC